MEFLTLSTGLLLPWLAGTVWLMAIEARFNRWARPNRLRQVGYGFFLGYAALSLSVLACNALFGQVSWPSIMALLAIVAACGAVALWAGTRPANRDAVTQAPLGLAGKVLLVILAVWTGLHFFFAASEVFNQPLYPWDAWLAWVYRAKAWYLAGGMADLVSPARWATATSADVYTIHAWTYPRFPSVVPYWAALSLGRWSETLVNLPALLAGAAIGLALYGQGRESGMSPLLSITACYLLFSVPLFGTHIALAGYADLWMAGFAGLGFIALLRGAVSGQRFQTLLGFLMIALAIGVKNEGAVWFLAALLMQALISFRWRSLAIAGVVLATAVWTGHAAFDISHLQVPLMGTLGVVNNRLEIPFIGSFALEVHNVWRVYLDNFFLMGSWNLLWLLVAASLLIAVLGKEPPASPARRAGVAFILVFLATQLFIFGFTDQGIWADTYTAINRLPLHFLPALIFAALVILNERMVPAGVAAAPERRHA
jgi:hypothetical protein